MKYDPAMSRAEVERCVILIQHHIRQARQNGDKDTLEAIRKSVTGLRQDSLSAIEWIKKNEWYQNLKRKDVRVFCGHCGHTFIPSNGNEVNRVQLWIDSHFNCSREYKK